MRSKLGMKVSTPTPTRSSRGKRRNHHLVWILAEDSGFSVLCPKTQQGKPSQQPDVGPLVYKQAETAVPFLRTEDKKPGQEARLPHR